MLQQTCVGIHTEDTKTLSFGLMVQPPLGLLLNIKTSDTCTVCKHRTGKPQWKQSINSQIAQTMISKIVPQTDTPGLTGAKFSHIQNIQYPHTCTHCLWHYMTHFSTSAHFQPPALWLWASVSLCVCLWSEEAEKFSLLSAFFFFLHRSSILCLFDRSLHIPLP